MPFMFRLKQLNIEAGVVSLAWKHSHMQGQLPYASQAKPDIRIANARHQNMPEPSVSSPSSHRYYVTWASKMTLLQSIVRFGHHARQIVRLELNYQGLRQEAEALAPVFICREQELPYDRQVTDAAQTEIFHRTKLQAVMMMANAAVNEAVAFQITATG